MSRSQPSLRIPRQARVGRRRVRLAALPLLLAPVALSVPEPTLSTERLVAMSRVPVTGIDEAVLPRVLPVEPEKAPGRRPDRAASVTRVEATQGEEISTRKEISPSRVAAQDIPAAALRAYRAAEATMRIADPSCRLSWALLAGIGRVESDHGRYGEAVLGANGVSSPHILGLPLNGIGDVAAIADTDDGKLDDDRRWDRAVGPMQFIPSTWAVAGVDGDADGARNPHDIDDAALAAAVYLCVGEHDLGSPAGLHDALFRYNHSEEYVALVSQFANAYRSGEVDLPTLGASVASKRGVRVGLGSPGEGRPVRVSDNGEGTGKRGEGADDGDAGEDNGRRRRDGKGTTERAAGESDGPNTSTDRPDKTRDVDEPTEPAQGDESGQSDDGGASAGRTDEPEPAPNGTGSTPTGSDDRTSTSGSTDGTDTDTGEKEQTPAADAEPGVGGSAGSGADTQSPQGPVVEEGVLDSCEPATKDTLCLDGDPVPAEVDRYGYLVENGATEVVLRHQSDGKDGDVLTIIGRHLAAS